MNFDGILAWLHTQLTALLANLSDVVANRPEAARSTVLYTLVTAGLVLVAVRFAKKVSK